MKVQKGRSGDRGGLKPFTHLVQSNFEEISHSETAERNEHIEVAPNLAEQSKLTLQICERAQSSNILG